MSYVSVLCGWSTLNGFYWPVTSSGALQVNLKEQGQLIRQDELLVTFRKKKCFRHIFLFQELILFSKTRKTDVGNETYIYKQSFKVHACRRECTHTSSLHQVSTRLPITLYKMAGYCFCLATHLLIFHKGKCSFPLWSLLGKLVTLLPVIFSFVNFSFLCRRQRT